MVHGAKQNLHLANTWFRASDEHNRFDIYFELFAKLKLEILISRDISKLLFTKTNTMKNCKMLSQIRSLQYEE